MLRIAFTMGLSLAALLLTTASFPAGEKKQDEKKLVLTTQENDLLKFTNEERKKAKLPPLVADPMLCEAARKHSANMAKQKKLAHDLDGLTVVDRVADTGYKVAGLGENVGGGGRVALKTLVNAWMKSEIHRSNILGEKFSEIGLGVVQDSAGAVWITQVFAQPQK